MARRNDHSKEQLVALVINAALTLVDELGPSGVTARRIADRIGYTPGTLYTHFDNLTDIFLHVNAHNLDHLEGQIKAAAGNTDDPIEAIQEMGYVYLNYAASHPNRFALMFTSMVPHGEDAPSHLQSRVDALFALVTKQLEKLWPELPEDEMELRVRTLWSSVHGVVSLSMRDQLFTRMWQADRRMLDTLIRRFLRAGEELA